MDKLNNVLSFVREMSVVIWQAMNHSNKIPLFTSVCDLLSACVRTWVEKYAIVCVDDIVRHRKLYYSTGTKTNSYHQGYDTASTRNTFIANFFQWICEHINHL